MNQPSSARALKVKQYVFNWILVEKLHHIDISDVVKPIRKTTKLYYYNYLISSTLFLYNYIRWFIIGLYQSNNSIFLKTQSQSFKQSWSAPPALGCPWWMSFRACWPRWSRWRGTSASCRPSPACQSGRPSGQGRAQQYPEISCIGQNTVSALSLCIAVGLPGKSKCQHHF